MNPWLADLRTSARSRWARRGLVACAAAALLAAASFAVWLPAERSRARMEHDIAAKRRALGELRHAAELAAAYDRAGKALATLEKKLDYAATQAELVHGFSRLARRHGVRIVGEAYEESRGAGGGAALSAELTLQGGYPALRDFLAGLAALPTWSEIQEVRLEAVQGSAEQKGRVRIVTYRNARGRPGSAS